MFQEWRRNQRRRIVQDQVRWYSLNDIVMFIRGFQDYILDPDYEPLFMPPMPGSLSRQEMEQRLADESFIIPESNGPYTHLMQELRLIWSTSRNRHQRARGVLAPNPLGEEEQAYFTSIRKILLWLDSGEGIYDRQRFEAYYGGSWNGGINMNDNNNINGNGNGYNGYNGNISEAEEEVNEEEELDQDDEVVEDVYQNPGSGNPSNPSRGRQATPGSIRKTNPGGSKQTIPGNLQYTSPSGSLETIPNSSQQTTASSSQQKITGNGKKGFIVYKHLDTTSSA